MKPAHLRHHHHHFHGFPGCALVVCCHCGHTETPPAGTVIETTYRPGSCGPFFPAPLVNEYHPSAADLAEFATYCAATPADDEPTEGAHRSGHAAEPEPEYAEGD